MGTGTIITLKTKLLKQNNKIAHDPIHFYPLELRKLSIIEAIKIDTVELKNIVEKGEREKIW